MRPELPRANGVGVMGTGPVQAGALTSAIDRPLPGDHPEMEDFARAVMASSVAALWWSELPGGSRRFAPDSLLEGDGFEPSVPRKASTGFGYSLLITKSLSAADSAPQTSPWRPASCRTPA